MGALKCVAQEHPRGPPPKLCIASGSRLSLLEVSFPPVGALSPASGEDWTWPGLGRSLDRQPAHPAHPAPPSGPPSPQGLRRLQVRGRGRGRGKSSAGRGRGRARGESRGAGLARPPARRLPPALASRRLPTAPSAPRPRLCLSPPAPSGARHRCAQLCKARPRSPSAAPGRSRLGDGPERLGDLEPGPGENRAGGPNRRHRRG